MPTLTLTYSSVPSTSNGLAQRLVDPLRDGLGADQRGPSSSAAVAFQVGEQQQELVAALAGHEIGLARRLAEAVAPPP